MAGSNPRGDMCPTIHSAGEQCSSSCQRRSTLCAANNTCSAGAGAGGGCMKHRCCWTITLYSVLYCVALALPSYILQCSTFNKSLEKCAAMYSSCRAVLGSFQDRWGEVSSSNASLVLKHNKLVLDFPGSCSFAHWPPSIHHPYNIWAIYQSIHCHGMGQYRDRWAGDIKEIYFVGPASHFVI